MRAAPMNTAIFFCMMQISYGAYGNAEQELDDQSKIEVIEVNARKRIENIQEVPLSITAFSHQQFKDLNIHDLQQLSKYAVSLEQPKLPIQSRLSIRGVSSGDNASFEQAVGIYVDEVYRGRMHQHRTGMFDTSSVEILHGPQVTLYGNSAIGGAVSIRSARPENDFSGYVNYKYEKNYQTHLVTSAINLPLSQDVAVRLSAKYLDQNEGIANNLFNSQSEPKIKNEAYRLSLSWQLNPSWDLYLRAETGQFSQQGHFLDVLKHVDKDGNPIENSIYTGQGDGTLNVGNAGLFTPENTFWDTKSDEALVELNYKSDSFEFKSLSALSQYKYQQSLDSDLTPLPLINTYLVEEYKQYSQEFRVSGQIQDTQYIAGVSLQKDDLLSDYFADFNTPMLLAGQFGAEFFPAINSLISPFSRALNLNQETQQQALWLDIEQPLTERLYIGLGSRWTKISKTANQSALTANILHQISNGDITDSRWLSYPELLANQSYLSDPNQYVYTDSNNQTVEPAPIPDYLLGYNIFTNFTATPHSLKGLEREEKHLMYNLSLRYQASLHTNIYATYAKGYKAGGFDLVNESNVADDAEYDSEVARVYELGVKHAWQNNRLNLALFHGSYDNLQVSVFNGAIGFNVANAPSSTSKGISVNFVNYLTNSLVLSVSGEYLDFEYDVYPEANCSKTEELATGTSLCDWSGRSTPFTPKYKANVNLEYHNEIGSSLLVRHLLNLSYKSEHGTASDNEVQTQQTAYSLLDYQLELTQANWDTSFYLAIYNLLDKEYTSMTTIIPLSTDAAFAYQLEKGREVAVGVEFNF
ncbi:TonB-dependent receptor [Catenovulum maritimum]|uniref:TonB-dependent receptor n=1 Tax=Catenovulum maritimum TaxID=1513271 RepID=A0A0J8GN19_9ALTE|nr:TonB-dependent receptor [Catenovulum maritimum]KMT64185.1 hypothetical protein XM47_15565 [Catenovulum maritimum]